LILRNKDKLVLYTYLLNIEGCKGGLSHISGKYGIFIYIYAIYQHSVLCSHGFLMCTLQYVITGKVHPIPFHEGT